MTLEEIKQKLCLPQYDFLRTNKHLDNNTILLGLGGSYAYGTNIETSDLDIRGIAINSKEEILTGSDFEQVENKETDTVVYSFRKIIHLLTNVNPNVIEMLGLKPEHYLYLSPIGQELINNRKMFLSRKCIQSFGGYATSQLYKLNQKSSHAMHQNDLEKHILATLKSMQNNFTDVYSPITNDGIKLYIDKSVNTDYDTEIFMDVNLTHYPLRDYCGIWSELQSTVKAYNKVGHRNKNAVEHGKIAKHMMHLLRLYMMCIDILEKEEIITYRNEEHELLMAIRNGEYLGKNNKPKPKFFNIVKDYEKRFEYAKQNTSLPNKPDYDHINKFIMSVNERIVKGEI